jgi:hypothetical protein
MSNQKCLFKKRNTTEETLNLREEDALYDYVDLIQQLLNVKCTIFQWQENKIDEGLAELRVTGCEHNSIPILLFDAKGVAKTFDSTQEADAFASDIAAKFAHVENSDKSMYFQMVPKGCHLKVNLVLKPNATRTVMCFDIDMSSLPLINSLN